MLIKDFVNESSTIASSRNVDLRLNPPAKLGPVLRPERRERIVQEPARHRRGLHRLARHARRTRNVFLLPGPGRRGIDRELLICHMRYEFPLASA